MKSFMEEYGRILVSAIVILVLVASANGIGGGIKDGMTATVDSFTAKMEEITNKIPGEGGSGGTGEEATTLAAGLYDAEGNMTISWEDLTSMEYQTITYAYYDRASGNVIQKSSSILNVDESGTLTSCIDTESGENASKEYLNGKLIVDSSVTSIGDNAFSYCYDNLNSITIGKSVTSIKYYAFGDCFNLTTINYFGTKEEWNNISFGSDWNSCCPEITVHCTDGDIVIPAN